MNLMLSPKQAFELKLKGRTSMFDGIEIKEGVHIIGDATYQEITGKWNALANVAGALCLIEIDIRMPNE